MSDFDEELLEIYETEERSDYFIKLHRGIVVPVDSSYYNEGRVEVEIFGRNFNEEYTYMININGQQYKINQTIFDKIKSFIDENLRTFIDWSIAQTSEFLMNNSYEGGMASSIKVKNGQLTVYINGQCKIYDEKVNNVIENIVNIITENQ